MEVLAPYRARIDALDAQIVDLLHARMRVVEEVARVKAREGIAAILPDRVERVRENAAARAEACGLDGAVVRALYTTLIDHSCAVESRLMEAGETDATPPDPDG